MSGQASQAAALAAFKAQNNKNDTRAKSTSPPKRNREVNGLINLGKNTTSETLPNIPRRSTSYQAKASSANSLPKIQTNGNTSPTRKAKVPSTPGAIAAASVYSPSINKTGSTSSIYKSDRASIRVNTPQESNKNHNVDYFNLPVDRDLSKSISRKSTTPTASRSNLTLDHQKTQDTIATLKNSLQVKSSPKDNASKRKSQDTSPNEMWNKIKLSMNSRPSSQTIASRQQKNKGLIDGIRESIDLKKIITERNSSSEIGDSLDFDDLHDLSSDKDMSSNDSKPSPTPAIVTTDETNENHTVYIDREDEDEGDYDNDNNNNNNNNEDDDSINDKHNDTDDNNNNTNDIDDSDFDNDNEDTDRENDTDGTNDDNYSLQHSDNEVRHDYFSVGIRNPRLGSSSTHSSAVSPISPIIVPPSSGANARELSLGGNGSHENIPHPGPGFRSFDSSKTLSDDSSRSKPRRKPPPSQIQYPDSNGNETDGEYISDNSRDKGRYLGADYYKNGLSSRSLLGGNTDDYESYLSNDDDDAEEEEQTEEEKPTKYEYTRNLPQFPDINDRSPGKHKHNPFKKKYKLKGLENGVSVLDLDDTGSQDPLTRMNNSRPSTPILSHQNQPVKLKTTMRETNNKKKKKFFNENKPWKNHTELNYVTKEERKRYEEVWTSNKGLYTKKVVTKLEGIDYEQQQQQQQQQQEQNDRRQSDDITDNSSTLNEMDPSMKAAKLSSKNNGHELSRPEDFVGFHNLDSADTNHLILGVVVQRIWARSRLPLETLGQIWDLVDYRKDGSLNKPEFIVGMWLVDQCLYGRKLPKKVDNEVWSSLENIGLNVVLKKRAKK